MNKSELLGATLALAAVGLPALAQPANDNCADAYSFDLYAGTPVTYCDDNSGATEDCSLGTGLGEAWYKFTTYETLNLRVSYCGTSPPFYNFYNVLDTTCPCSGAWIFASNWENYSCGDGNWTLVWSGLAAGTYYWPLLTDPSGAEGSYCVTFEALSVPFPPECPANTVYGQPATDQSGSWYAYMSTETAQYAYKCYDNFTNLPDPIADLHWWGLSMYYDPYYGWELCDPTGMTFDIEFYTDNGGMPGALVCSYQDVAPIITDIGSYSWTELYYFSVEPLPMCCELTNGWVSIQSDLHPAACQFLWLNSPTGDYSAYQRIGGYLQQLSANLAFCLTSGDCPAAPTGACCLDMTCLETTSVAHCVELGGIWYEGQTCPDFVCPNVCQHRIDLLDCYGDGWGGNTLDVLVNDVTVLSQITLASGAGPQSYYIMAATGDTIQTVYNAIGSSPSESYYFVYDAFGVLIGQDGIVGSDCWQTPTGITVTGNCVPPPVGGCCLPDGSCVPDVASVDCAGMGGVWQGEGTSCDPNPCTPFYCTAGATYCDEYINGVQIGTINNTSGCEAGQYADYSYLATDLPMGIPTSLTVTNGNPVWASDVCSTWVDWNQDHLFDDFPPELIGDVPDVGPYTFDITPPGGSLLGATRMRIRIFDSSYSAGLPCGTETFGEVEDYTIIVMPTPTGACCVGMACTPDVAQAFCEDTLGGQWQGAGSDCFPNPCILPLDYYFDPAGDQGGNGYQDQWYYYGNYNWWNMWWDNEFALDRHKLIQVSMDIGFPQPGAVTIALNWDTPAWTQLEMGRPPLPEDVPDPATEDLYIGRQILETIDSSMVPAYPQTGHFDFAFELPFCPDWVSMDVQGDGYQVQGTITHICLPPPDPTGACCHPDGTCEITTEVDCPWWGTWLGPATTCDQCLSPGANVALEAAPGCYHHGDTITVEVNVGGATVKVTGGQFFLEYDSNALQFVSMDPGDPPFTLEVYECSPTVFPVPPQCTPTLGLIDYAVGAPPGDMGTTADTTMARITFTAIADVCNVADVVAFRSHDPPTTLTDTLGGAVPLTLTDLPPLLIDSTPPALSDCPTDNPTVQCYADVPDPAPVTALDNCDGALGVQLDEEESNPGSNCNNVISRTWTATDSCGNSSSCVQTITVNDTTAPVLSGCPTENPTVQCYADVPDPAPVTALDNCDGALGVQLDEEESNPGSNCNNVISRTWTATDSCGSTSSCTQIITVNDTTAPVLSGCPTENPTVQCYTDVPAAANVTAEDNCDGAVSVQFAEQQSNPGSNCNNVVTRTWTATDSCGNSSNCIQTITVNDTAAPVVTCPPDVTVKAEAGCDGAHVTFPNATALDNCDGELPAACNPPSGSFFPLGPTIVTCSATDSCGNVSDCTFTVTVAPVNELVVTVDLDGVITTPVTRCITFVLWSCDPLSSVVAEEELTFQAVGGATRATTTLDVPCGDYTCLTARDRMHTLRRTLDALPIVGTQYVADFAAAGKPLIGGNLNDSRWVDILDFGVFMYQWNVGYDSDGDGTFDGNTACSTPYPHADVGGDGLVTTADFTFIQTNFLLGYEANCCAQDGLREDETGPVTRIAVADLIAQGLGALAAGDANADGWLDVQDMAEFAAGLPPPVHVGDLNCDGAVDFGDIDPFVMALSDPAAWQQAYPGCNRLYADVNQDGNVDPADINPFIALLQQ